MNCEGMMKNSVRVIVLAAGVAIALGGGTVIGAAQDKAAALKDRQDFMKAQGADVKKISDYAKGQGDKAAALDAAKDLVMRAPKIAALFVPGTSSVDFPDKSAAKPEIWQEKAKFDAIPVTLQAEEEKLVSVLQSGDAKAVGDQLGAVGKNGCGVCHETYRIKKS
jgi:cytochrome c556